MQADVHLPDLVDEQHAAVRLGDQAELGLGQAAAGELPPRALVDGVVHGPDQGIDAALGIVAQGRAVHLDKGRRAQEGRLRLLARAVECQARGRGLAAARPAVEQHVLGIGRAQRAAQPGKGLLLPDELVCAHGPGARKGRGGQRDALLDDKVRKLPAGCGGFGPAHLVQEREAQAVVVLALGAGHALFHQFLQVLLGLPAGGSLGIIFLQERERGVRAVDVQQLFDFCQHLIDLLGRPAHVGDLRLSSCAKGAHALVERVQPCALLGIHGEPPYPPLFPDRALQKGANPPPFRSASV